MDWRLILEFLVIVGSLAMGARTGGVGLGLWGAVGLLVLVVGFDVAFPEADPAELQAAWARPEQSYPRWHGPVPPYTYGQPSWA